jgi:hypothetical protein
MGKRDSRHTAPLPRWGMTTGEAVDSDVVEPADAKKDIGWLPASEKPPAEYFNWLSWAAYMCLSYIDSWVAKRWTLNHVMRNGKVANAGAVTPGAGLSVNVSLSRVWIEGAMYEVPAAVNLALAAADPTDPRNDLVVAQLTLGVPSYAIVTGTPAATPTDPALASDEVAMARVRVPALAVVPGTITSLRQFGALALDHLEVDQTLLMGDMGGGLYLVQGNTDNGGVLRLIEQGSLYVGGALLSVLQATGEIFIEPEAVKFPAPIRRKIDKGPHEFGVSDAANMFVTYATGLGDRSLTAQGNQVPAQIAYVQFCVPNGAIIKAARVYGNRAANDRGLTIELRSFAKGTGAKVVLGTATNLSTGAAGTFTLGITGLTEPVDQSKFYELRIDYVGVGIDATAVFGAELEYEETKPFDGI